MLRRPPLNAWSCYPAPAKSEFGDAFRRGRSEPWQ